MTEELYLSIFFNYDSESNTYNIQDQITGSLIGFCSLHDGPGWVYCPITLSPLMSDEMHSISELLGDLNALLE